MDKTGNHSPLGRAVGYADQYNPELLFPIPRQQARDSLGISASALPFNGVDIWNAYELSWLNPGGRPEVACAEFRIPCESANIIESKSFKLYLNSLNQSRFTSVEQLGSTLSTDLSAAAGATVEVLIKRLDSDEGMAISRLQGDCLDQLDITIDDYRPDPALLGVNGDEEVQEQLYSHLLRSLCPVTGQPDWGSVEINYRGPRINREGLLKYIIGYRQHQEFHEQCVERIFSDIMARCKPVALSVSARYLRRGGLDINPCRSNTGAVAENIRLLRQ